MLLVTNAANPDAKSMLQYIEEFCEERGLDKKIVDDVIRTYYTFVKQALINPELTRVRVNGLGFFEISFKNSNRAYWKERRTATDKKRYKHTFEFYDNKANHIQTLIDMKKEAFKDYLKARDEHRENHKKQKADTGRVSE